MTRARWTSLGLALLVAVFLLIWMATGELKVASSEPPPAAVAEEPVLTRVQVQTLGSPGL